MEEPSLLDYLKARLTPWRGPAPEIPKTDPGEKPLGISQDNQAPGGWQRPDPVVAQRAQPGALPQVSLAIPWRGLVAFFLALLAQRAFEPPDRGVTIGLILYGLAAVLLVWGLSRGEWQFAPPRPILDGSEQQVERSRLRYLLASLPFAVLTYWSFQSYLFNTLNMFLWGVTLLGVTAAFIAPWPDLRSWIVRSRDTLTQRGWTIKVTPWMMIALAVSLIVVFFRVFRLVEVPPEMISDHAEKLLDIADVLGGQYSVFFPRNTGREAFQMYLTAGIILVFKTGISFLSLKLGTVLAGLCTLPFVYLLGKELGNRNAGLYAMLFAGMAYWPNVTSRIALRFTLYPLFVAPTLFFLIRGLRTGRRNDFILAGLALGLGLHGYSSFRIVPLVVLVGVALFFLHNRLPSGQRRAFWGLVIIVLVSLVVFLPLLRYAVDNPEMFSYRTLTRVSSVERPLPGPVWQIFLQNFWNASIMFFWSNGGTWVHSVALRPALDVVTASLYGLGIVALLWRYLRRRNWADLFLLVSIPILLMPSILSLAFPDENPSLNRTTGAWVPVFVIVGLALDSLIGSLRRLRAPQGWAAAGSIGLLLVASSAAQNYDLVFNQYARQYQLASWNTTEVGHVVRAFADSIGTPNTVWVVGYPHWVDTRLVGINAGYPRLDYAIWPDQFESTLDVAGTKLFILKPEDQEGLDTLRSLYPGGQLRNYNSRVENKDFRLFLVPP